ncbi:MAG: Hsp20/alpha crystallin family protein [Anaerolineaceae bacterium]|jgi:HSP20 family molecular chaperone IbpA|nr:MAG: heat-shock protein Hsp20 [Chloroflexi bacterium HGW-Chloroflexi-8]
MTEELRKTESQKDEMVEQEQVERTRETRLFMPRVDIYETKENIYLVADIPGADQDSIDITLEKNILSIDARVASEKPTDYSLTYAEYGIGDFSRKFTLSNEVEKEGIVAVVKDGVLSLTLPKAGPAKTQRISVKSV